MYLGLRYIYIIETKTIHTTFCKSNSTCDAAIYYTGVKQISEINIPLIIPKVVLFLNLATSNSLSNSNTFL